MTTITNNPALRGILASAPEFFTSRLSGVCFKVAAVHTRFDFIEWFVWDMTQACELELPLVLGQFNCQADADTLAMNLVQTQDEIAGEVGMSFVASGGNPEDAGVAIFNHFAEMHDAS